MDFVKVFLVFFLLQVFENSLIQAIDFNVIKYGAIPGCSYDSSKAFLHAWNDACQSGENARVLIPVGSFLVNTVTFEGPCKGPIVFFLQGTMKAPTNPSSMDPEKWIVFQSVNQLTVTGGGVIDGQGSFSWSSHPLQISMRFDGITNSNIREVTFLNSKHVHLSIFESSNIRVEYIKISAPEDSPNTDGVKISESNDIIVSDSTIATGDDCVAILSGTRNINVTGIFCGPGHGISVGSLGKYPDEKEVDGIFVSNCTLTGTTNGARIKSWATNLGKSASGIIYENIIMNKVDNPIIIDQKYCPNEECHGNAQVESHVQIKNVTYKNIRGVSTTKVAIDLQCSKLFPCKSLFLENIELAYDGADDGATSSCSNAYGSSIDPVQPTSCF